MESKNDESVPEVVAEVSPSEEWKKKGNDCFGNKDYNKAIEYYTEGLKVDPNNAVLFSNRSACYAALKQWQKAYEDAVMSVSKDPKFIKGYLRLSTSQAELQLFDDAETTLKAAQALEPENDLIVRQLKTLKTKKAAATAVAKAKRGPKKLDEAQMKELMELQDQINTYNKDLRAVKLRLAGLQRESRVHSVTANHIQTLDESVPMYRSVGKAFVLTPKSTIEDRMEKEISESTKTQRDLTDRQEFLERRIVSATQNIQDIYA
jgi:tetratricopeptide (TPR) repeat protein